MSDLERRSLIKGIASLPLATVLATPSLARAAAETTRTVKITTDGGREVAAAVAMPATTPAPVVLLIHEWWGLNDQIKTMAVEFADKGYMAVAVDLFGRVATDPTEARALTQGVKPEEALDTMTSWVRWARNHQDSTRKLATVGWCFGGGWSLNTATAAPVDACVVYYGRCNLPAERLAKLEGPVLGHFATQDKSINEAMVGEFEANMKQAGKPYSLHWYEADHAFANPSGARYDAEDARLAWSRTLAFLEQHLRA